VDSIGVELFVVYTCHAHSALNGNGGVGGIKNQEVLSYADFSGFPAQESQTNSMEGPDKGQVTPARRVLTKKLKGPAAHLSGSFIREGDCQNIHGTDMSDGYQVGHPVGESFGLSGTGSSQD
jgi:hypothetical protein